MVKESLPVAAIRRALRLRYSGRPHRVFERRRCGLISTSLHRAVPFSSPRSIIVGIWQVFEALDAPSGAYRQQSSIAWRARWQIRVGSLCGNIGGRCCDDLGMTPSARSTAIISYIARELGQLTGAAYRIAQARKARSHTRKQGRTRFPRPSLSPQRDSGRALARHRSRRGVSG